MAKRRSTKQVVFSLEAYVADFQRGMRSAQGSLTRLEQTTTRFVRTWRNIGVYSGVAIILREMAQVSAKMAELQVSSINTSRAFQQLEGVDLDSLRQATGNMVDDLTLMQQAVKFENFGLPVQQLGKFLEFAQFRAATTGESIDYLVNSIVIGLGRKSIKVLDNLSLNVAEFQELVRGGLTYTDALAVVMDEAMGSAVDTVTSGVQELTTAWKNFTLAVTQSQGVNDFFRGLASFFRGMTPALEDATTRDLLRVDQLETYIRKLENAPFNTDHGLRNLERYRKELEQLNESLSQNVMIVGDDDNVVGPVVPNQLGFGDIKAGEGDVTIDGGGKGKIKLANFGDYVLPEESWDEWEQRLDDQIDQYVVGWNNAFHEVRQMRDSMDDPFAGALTDEVNSLIAYLEMVEPIEEATVELGASFADAAKEIFTFANAVMGVVDIFSKSKMEFRDWVRVLLQIGGFAAMVAGSGGFASAFPFLSGIFGRKALGGMASGLTLVGEAGPELVQFNQPARVYSNPQTARLLGTQSQTQRIEIEGDKLVILLEKLGVTSSYM